MKVSIYAMVSSLVLSSLFLSTVCMVRKRICFRRFSDVRIIGMFYLLCLIRLLPLDFTFTRGVNFKGIFSDIWDVLFDQSISIADRYFSIAELLALLALLVSFLKISRFLILYCRIVCQLSSLPKCSSQQVQHILGKLDTAGYKLRKGSVLCSGTVHMPYAIGPFRSRIILPDIDFSDDELYYILLHEYCHIKRHDLLKNFLLQILFCLIWWIPFYSLAMKDFQQILEIRCDRSVTKRMSREEACSYMEMMLSCLKKIPRDSAKPAVLSFALAEKQKDIKERFQLIAEQTPRTNKQAVLFLAIWAVIVLLSYVAVPFPYYENDYSSINAEAYLIINNDSYYIVYPEQNTYNKIPTVHALNLIQEGMKVKGDLK